tara:strand:- start:117 stop:554 length:438 start_codon:yes stop_codon:yes gene_type:complete
MKNLILLLTTTLITLSATSQICSSKYKRTYKKSYKKIETFLLKEGYKKSYNKTIYPKDEAGEDFDELNNFNHNVIFTKNQKTIYVAVTDKYETVNAMAYADWYFNYYKEDLFELNHLFKLVNFKTTLLADIKNKNSNEIFVIKGE